jgi:hypothetical protein
MFSIYFPIHNGYDTHHLCEIDRKDINREVTAFPDITANENPTKADPKPVVS